MIKPLALVLAAAFVASAGADASAATAIQDLSHGGKAQRVRLAVDAEGGVVAVWRRVAGTSSVIETATRPPGRNTRFGPVQRISRSGRSYAPQVAVNATGTAVVVWRRRASESRYVLEAALRPAGRARFGSVHALDTWDIDTSAVPSGRLATPPDVAIDDVGNIVVAYVGNDYNLLTDALNAVVFRKAGAREFQGPYVIEPDRLSPVATVHFAEPLESPPHVAFERSGEALISWEAWVPDEEDPEQAELDTYVSRLSLADKAVGVATLIDARSGDGDIATDAAGNALLWMASPGGIWLRTAGRDELVLGYETGGRTLPVAALTPGGGGVVAWSSAGDPSLHTTWLTGAARPQRFGPTRCAGPRRSRTSLPNPQLVADEDGTAAVAWRRCGVSRRIALAVGSADAGRFARPRPISAAGERGMLPAVVLDGRGRAVVAWHSCKRDTCTVRTRTVGTREPQRDG